MAISSPLSTKDIFLNENNCTVFLFKSTEICFWGSNRQKVSTGPDNDLVLNRQQAITSTNGEQVSWYQEDHYDWSKQLGLGKSTAY